MSVACNMTGSNNVLIRRLQEGSYIEWHKINITLSNWLTYNGCDEALSTKSIAMNAKFSLLQYFFISGSQHLSIQTTNNNPVIHDFIFHLQWTPIIRSLLVFFMHRGFREWWNTSGLNLKCPYVLTQNKIITLSLLALYPAFEFSCNNVVKINSFFTNIKVTQVIQNINKFWKEMRHLFGCSIHNIRSVSIPLIKFTDSSLYVYDDGFLFLSHVHIELMVRADYIF